jgi:peptide/nickel transport system substrate-binding protein
MSIIKVARNLGRCRARHPSAGRSIGRISAAVVLATSTGLLAAACSSSPSSSGSSSANAPAFTTTASWGPTSWSYSPFSTGLGAPFTAFGVQLPLAINEKTANQVQMFASLPQLMTSMTVSPSNLVVVHLVPGAKFSDGEPMDATAVVDTFLLDLVQQSTVVEDNVENISAPNSTTVDIQFTPQTANVNVRGMTTNTIPQPPDEYKQFLPASLIPTLWAYNKLVQNPKTLATAQSSPEYAKIEPYTAKLIDYTPKTLIGDGPFMVTGVNTSSITEVKSPTYFGASKVHVQKVTLLNTDSSGSSVFADLFSHDLDWDGNSKPSTTELHQLKSTSDLNVVTEPADQTEELLINNQSYPFTLTPVRQALAYLINRQTLTETEDGGSLTSNAPSTLPDGLGSMEGGIWLTAAQQAQLNPYNYSPSKATSLLQAAGFKKSGGKWIMPDGKPFTTTVIAPATPANAVVAVQDIAAQLSAFGIPATASSVTPAGYQTQFQKGDFQLAWESGVDGNLEPVCGVASGGLGSSANYEFGSNGADIPGEPGIGFGNGFNVPGLGKVDVSQAVISECQQTQAGPLLAALAWDWAQVVDTQVPFLDYADDQAINVYSTANYTNWPPASSPLWAYSGLASNDQWALLLMIEDGYISPAS